MSAPLYDTIRIGTLVDATQPDTTSYVDRIVPHGFESVQLTFGDGSRVADLQRLADELQIVRDGTGVIVSALGVYGNPLLDTLAAEQTRKAWQKLIESASLFGTDVVSGFTGRLPDRPIDESIPRLAEVFRPIVDLAADRGVRIAFENCAMEGSWSQGDWNIAHGPDAWELIFDALPDKNIGLEWEPCHQMLNLIDPVAQLETWVEKVFHIHGKCANVRHSVIAETGINGSEPFASHRFPGFGDADWSVFFDVLREGGYTGTIDVEGWHDPVFHGELEMTGQVFALNYLKHCRGSGLTPLA